MRNIRRRRTRARNRNPQKNQRSQNTPIRNEFEPSDQRFWAEGSDKGLSTQHLRPNIEPIYHYEGHTALCLGNSTHPRVPCRSPCLASVAAGGCSIMQGNVPTESGHCSHDGGTPCLL